MKLLSKVWRAFRKAVVKADHDDKGVSDRGLLIFEYTREGIKAESLLRQAGIDVAVKGPLPQVRTGCDLAVEFPIISGLQVSSILETAKIKPLQVLPIHDLLLEPVSIFQIRHEEIPLHPTPLYVAQLFEIINRREQG
jgi:hypothetical protein